VFSSVGTVSENAILVGGAYVATQASRLFALSAQSGSPLWSKLVTDVIDAPACPVDTRPSVWSTDLFGIDDGRAAILVEPCCLEEGVWACRPLGAWIAVLDPLSGSVLVSRRIGDFIDSPRAAADKDGNVYVGRLRTTVEQGILSLRHDLTLRWLAESGGVDPGGPSMVAPAGLRTMSDTWRKPGNTYDLVDGHRVNDSTDPGFSVAATESLELFDVRLVDSNYRERTRLIGVNPRSGEHTFEWSPADAGSSLLGTAAITESGFVLAMVRTINWPRDQTDLVKLAPDGSVLFRCELKPEVTGSGFFTMGPERVYALENVPEGIRIGTYAVPGAWLSSTGWPITLGSPKGDSRAR
jgi:hypothetical protein